MKMLKTVAMISLASVMAINTAVANTKTAQPAKSEQKVDKNLQQFTSNVVIKLTARSLGKDEKNQPVLQFHYEITNRSSKNDIKAVNWVSALTYNNQVVWLRDIPMSFQTPLKRKTTSKITMNVPAAAFQPEVQKLMMNPKVQIGSIVGAKSLEFTNGTKIIVSTK